MRNVFNTTLALLATTATLGLARPVAAQTLLPPISSPSEFHALALPRVVAPPPAAVLAPAAATPSKPAAEPSAPSAWLAAPKSAAPAKVVLIPSGLPNATTPKSVALVIASSPKLASQPLAVSKPPTRSWPPAHLVRKNADSQGLHKVAYFEPAPLPQAPVSKN